MGKPGRERLERECRTGHLTSTEGLLAALYHRTTNCHATPVVLAVSRGGRFRMRSRAAMVVEGRRIGPWGARPPGGRVGSDAPPPAFDEPAFGRPARHLAPGVASEPLGIG